MLKITAAAAIAAALCVAAGFDVNAPATGETSVPQRAPKSDRLPIGPDCSQAAWPNYESKCLRDTNWPQRQPGEVRVVRIISTDGLAGQHAVASVAN